MFFTQEDYRKIEEYLKKKSIKDTQFDEAITPLDGTEEITFVQKGKNVKTHIKDIVDQLFLLGVSDFLNVTDKYNQSYITIEEAIKLIPFFSRKKGQVITFLNKEGDWVIYQFKGESTLQWNNINLWVNLFESVYVDSILPDEEDLTLTEADEQGNAKLKFKDKEYDSDNFSGLGRVYLRKNIIEGKNVLLQDMISEANTIYHIQYDYDLNGQEITIPENCELKFDGGSFSNGTIVGNKTYIAFDSISIFDYLIILTGNWILEALNPEWIKDNDDRKKIQWCLNQVDSIGINHVKLASRTYIISGPEGLAMTSSTRISGGSVPANFHSLESGGNNNGTKLITNMEEGDILFVHFSKNQYSGGGCVIEGIEFNGNQKKCSGIHFRANNNPNRNIVVRECSFIKCQCGIKTSHGIDELVGSSVEFDSLLINWCQYGIYSDCLNNWVGLHIHDCTIEGNDEANIYLYHSGKAVCTSSIIIENNLLEAAPKGICLRTQKCNVRIEGNYFENGDSPQLNSIIGDRYSIIKIINNYEFVNAPSIWSLSYGKFIIEDTCKATYNLELNAELISCNTTVNSETDAINIYNHNQTLESINYEYSLCPYPDGNCKIISAFGINFPMWEIKDSYLKRVYQKGNIDDMIIISFPIFNPTENNININPNYQLLESGSVVQSIGVSFDVTPGFHMINIYKKVISNFDDINNYMRIFGGVGLFIGPIVVSKTEYSDTIKPLVCPKIYFNNEYDTNILLEDSYHLETVFNNNKYIILPNSIVKNEDGTLLSKVNII